MVTLLLTCLGVRADEKVVFEQHFESEQTAASTDVGFYEYINSMTGDTRTVEDGALKMFNDPATLCKTERWQRAVKFRNLPLVEGKTYRLDFKMKGSKTYNDGETDVNCKLSTLLMQGEDNADISLLGFDGAEQRLETEDFNPNEFVDYSKSFVFVSEQQQKEAYTKGELADKYFLTLSVFNPGTFYIKDVVLTETDVDAIETAEFGYSAIKIKFRGANNIADLAKADPRGVFVFDDISFATVTVDGIPAKIESIEYREDGCLYIFTDPLEVAMTDKNVISVTFTNPTDEKQIMFNGKIAASFYSFENLAPTYEGALDNVFSNLWLAPTLVSSSPAKNSFAIDPQLGEFSFTFDRKVETAGITAVLNRGGEESGLILKDGQDEYAETVVFVRNDNGVLAKSNTITLTNVVSEKGMGSDDPYVVSFEAGKPKVAEEIYTPVQTIDFRNANSETIPEGWTLYNNISEKNPTGELRPSGSSQGSGPRAHKFPQDGDYNPVFYVRSDVNVGTGEGQQAYGYTTATYGNMEGYKVTLPVGDLRIQFLASGYKKAGQTVRCEVLSADSTQVLAFLETNTTEVSPDWGVNTSAAVQEKLTVAYKNEVEQNVILRYTVMANGMTETILSGIIVNTYEKTEGDVPDDQVIFADATYGGAGNNKTPTAASGWELWQKNDAGVGEMRTPDADYNYKGTRIFNDLGLKGLTVGYYCNGQWPNGYVIYGTGELEGAPKLTLPAGSLDITYYAANWKVNEAREIHFEIVNSKGVSLVDKVTYTSADKNMDGQRGASYEADKFQFSFECPAAGDYMIKLGSPAGETFMGNISIVKPGSRAVKYYALLAQAVKNAKAALEKVADPIYDGATKTTLIEVITMYEDQSKIEMTTEEEFKAAIEEVEGLTKSMLTRFEYIPRFKKALEDAEQAYTSAITTKYEKLECFEALGETIETYGPVDPSDFEDEELVSATTEMENNTTLFKNMTTERTGGVALLTKQITDAADQLVEYDATQVEDEYVVAARNAIADDQEIAEQLKLRLTKAIYDKCVEGDPFNIPLIDPETGEPYIDPETGGPIVDPDSISTTGFIQNPNFYVKVTSESREMQAGDEIPGWNINKIQGNVGYEFSWVAYKGSNLNPIIDTYMISGWNSELDFSQMLTELPVGKYRLVVSTQDRSFDDNCAAKKDALETIEHWTVTGNTGEGEIFSYIYTQKGDSPVKTHFDISAQGQWYGLSDCNSYVFDVTEDDPELATGSVLVGAHTKVFQSTASFDNFRLYMIGKAEDYNYATAAAKLAERIKAGEFKKGDVNGDGLVNSSDVLRLYEYMAGQTEGVSFSAADVNEDGFVNSSDVLRVYEIMAGN